MGRSSVYEIAWLDGRVDIVDASQLSWSNNLNLGMSDANICHFHGNVEGKWTLLLSVNENQIKYIRNLSQLGSNAEYEFKVTTW